MVSIRNLEPVQSNHNIIERVWWTLTVIVLKKSPNLKKYNTLNRPHRHICNCLLFILTQYINRIIRMNKNFSFEKVWCFYDRMSLSRDRIWHYFSMKPYTEIATATFVLDKNCTEKKTIFPYKIIWHKFWKSNCIFDPQNIFFENTLLYETWTPQKVVY